MIDGVLLCTWSGKRRGEIRNRVGRRWQVDLPSITSSHYISALTELSSSLFLKPFHSVNGSS